MLCLGIETSCDETALALVRDGICIDSIVSSQVGVHALFGGVVPELASREHFRYLPVLYDILMERNGLLSSDLDLISVARGPGLLGALLVGVSFAKALAFGASIPVLAVNHLQAHLLAVGLEREISFPALGLLVSGGHTHLYSMSSALEYCLLGRTLDDAAGEACDKFAKMLGLPYPGGALIDALACRGEADAALFPRPYTQKAGGQTLDFSFSGLKTAALSHIRANPSLLGAGHLVRDVGVEAAFASGDLAVRALCDVCASYLLALTDTLLFKCRAAFVSLRESGALPRSFILAGGVAANTQTREMARLFCDEYDLELCVPSFSLCTDNASMIAYLGYLQYMEAEKAGFKGGQPLNFACFARGQKEPGDVFL